MPFPGLPSFYLISQSGVRVVHTCPLAYIFLSFSQKGTQDVRIINWSPENAGDRSSFTFDSVIAT